MYFKRLELFGFKSFADKTRIKFEPGATAVVGPNGCGKSNISDAIKWVLGEQSPKELRGARMEDVIFNGTANKEPINMAEVSLVLDNKDKILPIDFEEVVITRRLFRSGESEYLLNKMPVRLKDINDLLAGTGIGTSAYSMIEQGRIGLIVSSKPEDRRYLLEEASGITKFKLKKKEALRKLEHTDANLVRISDIITEVNRQIQSIERQAKKAEKYKVDFETLKDLELKLSSFQYRNIANELKTLQIECDDYKRRLQARDEHHSALVEDVARAKSVIDRITGELHAHQRELSETLAAIDKNTHTVMLDRERIDELKELQKNLVLEAANLKLRYDNKKKDLEDFQKRLDDIGRLKSEKEATLTASEAKVQSLRQEVEAASHEVKAAKAMVLEALTAQTRMKNDLIKLGAELQNRKNRLVRLKLERENVSREKSEVDSKVGDIDRRTAEAQTRLNTEKGAVSDLRQKRTSHEESLDVIRREIIDSSAEREVLKSKRDMLIELVEKSDGFLKSVKAIIEKTRPTDSPIKAYPLA
ncbi:MAG: AAA family ATPase, partial [Candidatus Omnitrophica bacterium]|nr:AAA family ATPase [Candidatus Omnitrophota bacterium]